jgi:hypothetical protein
MGQWIILAIFVLLFARGMVAFIEDYYAWMLWDILRFDFYLEMDKKIKKKMKGE